MGNNQEDEIRREAVRTDTDSNLNNNFLLLAIKSHNSVFMNNYRFLSDFYISNWFRFWNVSNIVSVYAISSPHAFSILTLYLYLDL